eukprot:TRINITY_DN29105_c0_g2_i1.p1 TRINITY_DN29105_c0_g2~~TRINITY_DN29105_c0_g2_i1.p1  ORF type:complete len:910 (-),score=79.78 TRINITY_DN29105_c0_g2_i1:96-2825(-)
MGLRACCESPYLMVYPFVLLAWNSECMRAHYSDDVHDRSNCTARTTCESCIAKPPRTFQNAFGLRRHACAWCPQAAWGGQASDIVAESGKRCVDGSCGGVCRSVDDKAFLRRCSQQIKMVSRRFAETPEGVCSAPIQPLSKIKLNSFTKADLTDPLFLETLLTLVNVDMARLNRFRVTAPNLFRKLFDIETQEGAKAMVKNGLKTAVWALGTIDGVTNTALSLGLGLIHSAAELIQDSAHDVLQAQRASQLKLCTEGGKAKLEYLSDVKYGLLRKHYDVASYLANSGEPTSSIESVWDSDAAQLAGTLDDQVKSSAVQLLRAGVHTSLFVGGFATGGATWAASTALGALDLAGDAALDFAHAKTLEHKSLLLVILAKMLDRHYWLDGGLPCFITAWSAGMNPCQKAEEDEAHSTESQNKPGRKYMCVRSSPWYHHRDVVPAGNLGHEGRCMPRVRQGFFRGYPCVSHEACASSYCHFEPRLLYFFSDHKRKFCSPGKCDASKQLIALQAARNPVGHKDANISETQSDDNLHSFRRAFTSTYKTSPKGLMYATMGTCEYACPKEDVRQKHCAMIRGFDEREYSFGLLQEKSVFGDGKGYRKVGNGWCAKESLGKSIQHGRYDLNVFGGAVDVDQVNAASECGKTCSQTRECKSFTIKVKVGSQRAVCFLHSHVASTTSTSTYDGVIHCYNEMASWPMDIFQPWNIEWHYYILNLKFVIRALESPSDSTSALQAVREQYSGYCGHVGWFENTTIGETEGCESEEKWSAEEATFKLRKEAPLSSEQLRLVRERIAPGSTETPAKPGETIELKDLPDRQFGFGPAWKLFLDDARNREAILRAEELGSKDDVRHSDHDAPRVDKMWVQTIEMLALQYEFRTSDGTLNFRQAQKRHDKLSGKGTQFERDRASSVE